MPIDAKHLTTTPGIVHHVGKRGCFATRGRVVLKADRAEGPWRTVTRFPFDPRVDPFAVGRLATRLLRADKCNVYPTRTGALLGIRQGRAYRLDPTGARTPEPLFSIEGDCVMNRAIAEDTDGCIYFGEYFMNPARKPVRIFRIQPDLRGFEVAHAFDAPRPRHVHAVHADPFRPGRLWVTMGDFEGECYLACSDDRLASLEFIGDGSQTFRMVGVLFREDRIHWLTDSHIEQNRIVSMDRATHEIEIHGERDASSWYLAETTDGRYLATTTVEPGPGIHTDEVRLLVSDDAVEWRELAAFDKDAFPMRGFGFGSLSLPSGELDAGGFWISGEGVVGLDGRSAWCRVGDRDAGAGR